MKLTTEEKEKIKTYFLIKEGIEITEITEFYGYTLLKPYVAVLWFDNARIKVDFLNDCKIILSSEYLDLKGLNGFYNLEHIEIYCKSIMNTDILSNLTNIKLLRIQSNSIVDISFIKDLKKLKYMSFKECGLKDLPDMSNLKELEHLVLWGNENLCDISSIRNLKNLKYLDIDSTGVENIEPLLDLPNLKEIIMFNTKVERKNLIRLKNHFGNKCQILNNNL